MTETEVADAIMEIIGFDQTQPRITEVEAGNAMNEIEIEIDNGEQRFTIRVEEKL